MLKNSEREVRGAASQERIIWFSMLLLALASVAIALFLSNANVVITHNNLKPPKKKTPSNNSLAQAGKHAVAYTAPSLWFIMLIVVIVSLIIFLVCLFLWLRWQKLQRRAAQSQKQEVEEKEEEVEEVHETLFNWSLFLAQLLALLALLNPFGRRKRHGEGQAFDGLRLAEPGIRSIREVYRALLKQAARRGQTRARDETPYEFWCHLGQQEALAGPELEAITKAYVLARYSGTRPGTNEVARVK